MRGKALPTAIFLIILSYLFVVPQHVVKAATLQVLLTGSAAVSEAVGTTNVTVSLENASATLSEPLVIPVEIIDFTAVFNGATGDMYIDDGGTPVSTINVTFPAGAGNGATQVVPVTIVNDRTVEASSLSSTGFNTPEAFNVTFGTLPPDVTASGADVTVSISENDFAYITMNPTFVVNDTTDIESNTARTANVQIRIVSNGTGTEQVQDTFTVPLSSSALGISNDATLNADYTFGATSVSFPALSANNAQQPVTFTVVNDNVDEFYGALNAFNQNREFFDVGFNVPAVRASYAGVPILIPDSANDNCNGTSGLPNLPGSCRSRHTNIILDDDTAMVNFIESSGNTAVTEGGLGDSYTVVLTTQPTSNVTVNLAFDQTQLTVNGDTDGTTSLIFTTANWSTPQAVSVFAVNDTVVEANPHTSLITQTLTSTDLIYNAINPADVTVSITDNDTATITFTNSTSTVAETVGTHNVTARLDMVTNGIPGGTLSGALTASVNATLGTAESADFAQTTNAVTFAAGSVNGATQPISFTIVNDLLLEGNDTFALTYILTAGTGSVTGTHTVTITDNEAGLITFGSPTSTASEGTTPHDVTAQLTISGTGTGNAQLENDASVAVISTPGTAASPADYTSTANLTFSAGTNSPISSTISNTIVNDSLVEANDETFSLGFGAVTGSGTITANETHVVTIDENDLATVTFSPGNDTISEAVGVFNKTVTLTITSNPTGGTLAAPLSIPYAADELSATEPEDYTVVGTTIDFPAGATSGTVVQAQVNIINDLIDENAEFFEPKLNNNQAVLAFASNIRVEPRGLTTVQILDNDTANITVNPTTVEVNEEGPTSQDYTVVLTTQPTANVTVNLVFDPLQITVNGDTDGALSLTFTNANWNTAQTITVLTVDDFIIEGPHSTQILQTASSPDAKYNVLNPADVTVNITDNDTPGSQVVESGGNTTVSEADVVATDSYTIRLDSRPTADVTVNLAFDAEQISLVADGTPFTTSPATFIIAAADWNVLQTVEVVVVDDNVDETSPYTTLITQIFTSPDTNYNTATGGVKPADVTVSIIDNDTSAIQISPTAVNVAESSATETYTIEALTRPTANVIVTLTFNSAQIRVNGQVSPVDVILTPTDFSETVTVSAVDDNFDETDPHLELITHAIASTDPFYNTLTDGAQVTVNITDNDTAGVVFSSQQLFSNEGDTTPTPLTVQLASQPSAAVTVSLAFDTQITLDGTTTTPLAIVIQPADWNTPVTVDVLAVDDLVDEVAPHNSNITPSATSTDPLYNGAGVIFTPDSTITVTINDNDVATVTVTEASGTANDNTITVVEGGAGSSFSVALNTEPTANVEVSMTFNDVQLRAGSPTPGASPQTVIFTPVNWNVPQTVNVTAVDDVIFQNIGSANISLVVGSTDPFYVGAPFSPNQTVIVNIVDDEAPDLVFTNTDGTPLNQLADVVVREGFLNDQYRVELNSQPLGDVSVTLTFDDTQLQVGANGNPAGGSPLALTFTVANWNIPQVIEVQSIEDFTQDPGTEIITHDVTSAGDVFYNALPNEDVTVTIQDGVTTPPDTFALVRPANNILIPDTTLLTDFRWEDTFNTGSPGITFDFTVTRVLPDDPDTVVLTYAGVSRVADVDPLTCDGTLCVLTIGAAEQALLTDGVYQWTVTANSPIGSTVANNASFTFTVNTTGNLLSNGGFEIAGATGKSAVNWRSKGFSVNNDRRVCNTAERTVAFDGNCAFRFRFNGTLINTNSRLLRQVIRPTYGLAGDTLNLSVMVRANNQTRGGRVELRVVYASGLVERSRVSIPIGTYDYQMRNASLMLTGTPTKIIVEFQPRSSQGVFFVDATVLTLTSGTVLQPTPNQPMDNGTTQELLPLPNAPTDDK